MPSAESRLAQRRCTDGGGLARVQHRRTVEVLREGGRRADRPRVPLVELKLTNAVGYSTDSAEVAALDEPSLRGREAFLGVRSHGYEYSQTVLGAA